jgi:hypothetical protein
LPSIFQAAADFESVMEEIDNCSDEELNASLVERFKEADATHALAVDRRMEWAAKIKAYKYLVKHQQKALKADMKRLERMESSLKHSMKSLLEAFPQVPFRSSTGKKVWLQGPSNPKLNAVLNLGKKTLHKILDEKDLEKVPPRYVATVSFKVLDTDVLKYDLLDGKEIEWASLDSTKTVRGL